MPWGISLWILPLTSEDTARTRPWAGGGVRNVLCLDRWLWLRKQEVFWEQLPQGRAQVHPTPAVFIPTAVGGSWLLQAAQQQDGPSCSKNKKSQEKDLRLSHLCCMPGPSPCCILPAWQCWQRVLAAGRGCVLMLCDSKVPLLCSAREVVPERCIFNVREELSLDGLSCKPSRCGRKRRKRSGKKESQGFFVCVVLCVAALVCGTQRDRSSVWRSCSVIPSREF